MHRTGEIRRNMAVRAYLSVQSLRNLRYKKGLQQRWGLLEWCVLWYLCTQVGISHVLPPNRREGCSGDEYVAVRLRLKRMGRTHRSFFRLSAMDSRSPRDGRVIEELGWYDPSAKNPDEEVSLKRERIEYWLSVGAQPSDTVRDLLKKRLGISVAS